MGFTSVVSAYLHMLITVPSYQELGRYRGVEAGALLFQLFVHAKPSCTRGYNGRVTSGFCHLTVLSGYPRLAFTESDTCMSEQAFSIAPDQISFSQELS